MHENGALRSAYAETDLQLNPQHPAYKGGAVQRLIAAAQDYLAANAGRVTNIRLVSNRAKYDGLAIAGYTNQCISLNCKT
jgi:hypothetical protein